MRHIPMTAVLSALVLCAALIIAPAPTAAAQDVPAPQPPDRALLVVQAQTDYIGGHVDTVPRLLVIATDGTVRRLVEGQATGASWSPDGSQVAYRDPVGGAIHVTDRDGSPDVVVLDGAQAEPPAWSPDGTSILGVTAGDGGTRLVAVDPVSGAQQVLHAADAITAPVWSPSGDRIAFGVVTTSGGQYDLWTVDRDGTGAQQLTTDLRVSSRPTWSPDGSHLAVVARPTTGDTAFSSVYLVSPDGSGVQALEGPPPASSEAVVEWSPFSSQIAYSACQPGGCGAPSAVAVVSATGDADPDYAAPVGDATAASLLAWRGPSQLLVEQSHGDTASGVLVEVDLAGGAPRVVSEPLGGVSSAAINPGQQPPPLTATVARSLWWSRMLPDGRADAVLLGRADEFADSLAAGGAQGALDAPLLLTPTDRLEEPVAREIERLGAGRVVLLGGEDALSPAVEDALRSAGLDVSRIAGPTRLETAVAIAETVLPEPRRILLARAYGEPGDPTAAFADSLAAGAAAAGLGSPLLLTQTTTLSTPVGAYLDRTPSVQEVVVVGGVAAVGESVVADLEARGLAVTRVAGPERAATAAAVASFVVEADAGDDTAPPPGGTYVMVDGTDPLAWADGFAAALVGDPTIGGGVLLTRTDEVPQPTYGVLATAVPDSTVACASLLPVTTCRDAEGAHATATPEAVAEARLESGEVFGDVRVLQDGPNRCVIVTLEGAELDAARIEGDEVIELPQPASLNRIVHCVRDLFTPLDVDQLLAADAEAAATTAAGQELRAPLRAGDQSGTG